ISNSLGQNGPMVSKLGLGCMRMSSVWGGPTPDETESIATIHQALDSGINFLNTGDFYGAGHNEMLIGKALKGRRDEAFIRRILVCFHILKLQNLKESKTNVISINQLYDCNHK
ncbi:aldo/keto reductase, partial [Flavobacterium sp. B17]|uniref:aldo/keto reductase n=1 Tax=Flavobacterium sp. B17 TaxID=95618 RepID=UPI0005B2A7DA